MNTREAVTSTMRWPRFRGHGEPSLTVSDEVLVGSVASTGDVTCDLSDPKPTAPVTTHVLLESAKKIANPPLMPCHRGGFAIFFGPRAPV